MAQENTVMTLASLRNDRTFATICQFFHTFQSAFRPWPNYSQGQWVSLLNRPPTSSSSRLKSDAATQDDYVFSTEDLEDMLIDASRRYQLEELIIRMLRLLTRNRLINSSTWQDYFSKEWDRREFDQINPFHVIKEDDSTAELTQTTNDPTGVTQQNESMDMKKSNRSFFDLSMETRLILLNTLCEWQLDDPERLREHLNDESDPSQWRVDPICYDKKGNTFWLFDDNRLYQESAPFNKKKAAAAANRKKKKSMPQSQATRRNTRRSTRVTTKPDEHPADEEDEDEEEEWVPWKLVCMTVNDWQQFPQKYSKSIHAQDQLLHEILVEDVLPKVIPVIEEHEKDRKKQEAIIHRKRSSRILVRELEALEQHQAATTSDGLLSQQEPLLSRSEARRLQREAEEKERQAKAREERVLERERKLFEKAQAEERAAEKARLDREKRLARRQGDMPTMDMDAAGDDVDILTDYDSSLQQQQQQGFKLILTVGDPKKKSPTTKKDKIKKKKETKDSTLGKRKRGRKPKARLEEESWTFNCTCGIFGKNIDDGTPMIACERCDEWQHIDCLRKSGQVDTQLTSFDDLTFICRRCINKQAMPTPPQSTSIYTTTTTPTNNGSLYNPPTGHPRPVIQSSERHFFQQQPQIHQSSSYTPSFIKPKLPQPQPLYTELNGTNNPSSSFANPTTFTSHQQPLPSLPPPPPPPYYQQQQQQQPYYQHQQQHTLPSLPQNYSRPPMQLDPLGPPIPSSSLSSSSSSAFQSITTKNIMPPPPPPSNNPSMTTESTHQTFPHAQ